MPQYGSKDWFEEQYEKTDEDPWGLEWRPTQQYRYGTMLEQLLQEVRGSAVDEGLVIDIGCATGGFTRALAGALAGSGHYRMVGADLSATAIDRARQKSPDIEFRVGALEDTAAEFRGTAGVAAFLEVLYYTPREGRPAAIDTLHSLLKPGGLLLISAMLGKPPYFSQAELEALVAQRFTILKSGCLNLWPLVALEKLWLKIAKPGRAASRPRYLPGDPNFERIARVARLSGGVFGRRAQSHAFVIARA